MTSFRAVTSVMVRVDPVLAKDEAGCVYYTAYTKVGIDCLIKSIISVDLINQNID